MAEIEANELKDLGSTKKKKIIFMAVIVFIQALISFLLITLLFKPPSLSGEAGDKLSQCKNDDQGKIEHQSIVGEIFLIEDLVINPAGTRGRRFVSFSIGIELNEGRKVDEIKKREAKICDAIISLFVKKRFYEFTEISNRENIRRQMFEAIKKIMPEDMVRQIYITKFILQ